MFTPTNDLDGPISFMDPYSSLQSPFIYFELDGYVPNYYYYHEESLSAGDSIAQPFAESSNEPISASSKMKDANQGDMNGIVEDDKSRNNHGSIKQISRRRSSKGDRHSKIPTAQGLRDRRMRLSLEVARQFFKLQDMLSYDKPSQTVKWLLLKANPAIDRLKETKQSPSSPDGGRKIAPSSETIVCDVPIKVKRSTEKPKRKMENAFNPAAKELRKKARERARDRTQRKKQASMVNDPGRCLDQVLSHQQFHVRPKVSLQIGDDSSSQSQNWPSLDDLYKTEQQIQDVGIPFGTPKDFTGTSLALGTANWSQMSLNYHQEDQTFQDKPLQEFQFHGASWEPYNHPHV